MAPLVIVPYRSFCSIATRGSDRVNVGGEEFIYALVIEESGFWFTMTRGTFREAFEDGFGDLIGFFNGDTLLDLSCGVRREGIENECARDSAVRLALRLEGGRDRHFYDTDKNEGGVSDYYSYPARVAIEDIWWALIAYVTINDDR